jgi:hypothetical protein
MVIIPQVDCLSVRKLTIWVELVLLRAPRVRVVALRGIWSEPMPYARGRETYPPWSWWGEPVVLADGFGLAGGLVIPGILAR